VNDQPAEADVLGNWKQFGWAWSLQRTSRALNNQAL